MVRPGAKTSSADKSNAQFGKVLHSAANLRVYKSAPPKDAVVSEYEVHGIVPETEKLTKIASAPSLP